MIRLGKWVAVGSMALASFSAQAASWALDEGASSVHFVTVKNAVIAETHEFLEFSGAVAADEAAVAIALGSVETLIPIRNERMREMLFEVARFPEAILTAPVARETLEALAPGESVEQRLRGTLSLKNSTIPLEIAVRVSRQGPEAVRVESLGPVMVSAEQLGLATGVEALRAIAGLNSITPMVPVSFSLLFRAP
ncbi:MAG: YceI family protein [Pseudomonadales bacterium]|nr:YceI family protein [Pseudomonadales bacterium]